jgi:hypothetical protein
LNTAHAQQYGAAATAVFVAAFSRHFRFRVHLLALHNISLVLNYLSHIPAAKLLVTAAYCI